MERSQSLEIVIDARSARISIYVKAAKDEKYTHNMNSISMMERSICTASSGVMVAENEISEVTVTDAQPASTSISVNGAKKENITTIHCNVSTGKRLLMVQVVIVVVKNTSKETASDVNLAQM